MAEEAYHPDGLVQRAVKALKDKFPTELGIALLILPSIPILHTDKTG
ncbi:delta-aminolevulinic acid dehydratase [Pasteurella multocida subsp. multocida str. Anand1_cattle]|nr:delta-aminolevulinic acid dehydratase [Pasteurella multocida subsp. multocida str. Anand1_cattle]